MQVSQYWSRYRLALVTNYRNFLLVGNDADGTLALWPVMDARALVVKQPDQ